MDGNVLIAFCMTLVAGLSTGIGSIIGLTAKKDNTKFLAISLGFSAGVMVYVSFIEIMPSSFSTLIELYGDRLGTLITVVGFFGGMLLIGIIDGLIPSGANPHEYPSVEQIKAPKSDKSKLYKTGLYTAIALAIHNFPEGLATFVSALQDPALAIPIVVAIAIHNIPEGLAVSIPIYHSTGDKKKAFIYSFVSGLAEPFGALVGYVFLLQFMTDTTYGILFAIVGGIMVYISFDELLPAAEEYGEHHLVLYGLIGGMVVMAISLIMFL